MEVSIESQIETMKQEHKAALEKREKFENKIIFMFIGSIIGICSLLLLNNNQFNNLSSSQVKLESKVELFEVKVNARFDAIEAKLNNRFDALETKLNTLLAEKAKP